MKQFNLFSVFLLLLASASFSWAESDEGKTAVYVKLSKGMVVNYGEPSLSRLKYMKVVVQVRLQSASAIEAINHHMPALLDALITLFSACDEDLIDASGGREEIRSMALEAVNKVLDREEGEPLIQDLLFGSFIIQR
ncbi:MAG: flagellar basal body-associated FliL family protein [Pseudomonadales bacterium]|nr:flagellar basal body-associated FliL family protein [Pseudomonadales bacterium]